MTIKKSILDIFKKFLKKSGFAHTEIKVFVGHRLIGAIQNIQISERLKDNHFDIEAGRVRFDRSRLTEIFSRQFVNPNAQRLPFQIEIDDGDQVTTVVNAWLLEVSASYENPDWVIIDRMKLEAETITTKESLYFTFNCTE